MCFIVYNSLSQLNIFSPSLWWIFPLGFVPLELLYHEQYFWWLGLYCKLLLLLQFVNDNICIHFILGWFPTKLSVELLHLPVWRFMRVFHPHMTRSRGWSFPMHSSELHCLIHSLFCSGSSVSFSTEVFTLIFVTIGYWGSVLDINTVSWASFHQRSDGTIMTLSG